MNMGLAPVSFQCGTYLHVDAVSLLTSNRLPQGNLIFIIGKQVLAQEPKLEEVRPTLLWLEGQQMCLVAHLSRNSE